MNLRFNEKAPRKDGFPAVGFKFRRLPKVTTANPSCGGPSLLDCLIKQLQGLYLDCHAQRRFHYRTKTKPQRQTD